MLCEDGATAGVLAAVAEKCLVRCLALQQFFWYQAVLLGTCLIQALSLRVPNSAQSAVPLASEVCC